MELKKSPKADLENKRGLFLEIGLLASVLMVAAVFAYNQSEKNVEIMDMVVVPVEEDIIEVTRQDQKPPEPVKATITYTSDILNIIKDDAKIETKIDFSDFDEDAIVAPTVRAGSEEGAVADDEPFLIAEDMPKFDGGDIMKFRNWVQGKVVYPSIAAENSISGTVTVQFVIEKDGTLSNITVLQNPDRSLTDEAIRVLKTSPKWTPGKQRNMPVRVKYTLPVVFRIQN